MACVIYRKESDWKFKKLFSLTKNTISINNKLVFNANLINKNKDETYRSKIIVNDESKKSFEYIIIVSVKNNILNVKVEGRRTYFFTEQEVKKILDKKMSVEDQKKSFKYQIIFNLCQNHSGNSQKSPLISCTLIPTFSSLATFCGHKFEVQLKSRIPFKNMYEGEDEYFLIGEVNNNDCDYILYIGEQKENGCVNKELRIPKI